MEDTKPWAELMRSLQSVENNSSRDRDPLGGSKAVFWEGETQDRNVNRLMLGNWTKWN